MLKNKRHKEEEHVSSDRYLITYSDLITLLLGLFVILYAVSSIDEEKYKQISMAFSDYFTPSQLQGGSGVLPGRKDGVPEPILPSPKHNAGKTIQDIEREAREKLSEYISKGRLQLTTTASGLTLTMPEKLLFESGSADIQPEGSVFLEYLGGILRNIDYQVSIDGHTDSDPIRNGKYATNWHLSVNRAANVGIKLVESGMPENILAIRGFSYQRPVADNVTAEGKSKNRRVEIIISERPQNILSTEGYKSADTNKENNY